MNIFSDGYQPVEIKGRKVQEVIEIGSAHSLEDSLELVFYLKGEGDIRTMAERLARDETTGSWVGKGSPTALFQKAMADIDKIYVYGKGEGVIFMRTPLFNTQKDNFLYQIMMLAVGGPVLEFVYYSSVAFLDFCLPEKVLKKFPGPGFGLEGIRKLLGIRNPGPIMGTIIKPCAGLTPEEVAEKCYQAARGGCQFIKDDEKMLGPEYCPEEKKIKLVSQALRKAYEETGHRCIYAPHLVARADRLLEKAKRFISWGATGLMLNIILGHNVEVLQMLRECPDINVPLYAHSGGRSGISTGPRRIDDTVWVKLVRLCGGDFFQHGVFGVQDVHVCSREKGLLKHLIWVMREEKTGIKDMIPVAAGGLSLEKIPENLREHYQEKFGYGVALLAGSHLLNDPAGPEQASRKIAELIDSFCQQPEA